MLASAAAVVCSFVVVAATRPKTSSSWWDASEERSQHYAHNDLHAFVWLFGCDAFGPLLCNQ